jgi:hypothetical protein
VRLKVKFYWRLLAILIFALLPAAVMKLPAFAQNTGEPTAFKNVHLWINPEYDDPRLLVMLEGQVDGAEPPAPVRFLVPAAAEMYSAGSKDSTGKYTGGPPARKASTFPGWDEISYNVTTPIFRVEYYDPSITGLANKSITYEFKRLYPISSLQVIVQEPRGAKNFTVSPKGSSYVDGEGFNTQVYSYAQLAPEAPVSFNISYIKTDPRPSLEISGGSSSGPALAVGIIIGLALVTGGALWWRNASRGKKRARRPPQRDTAGVKKAGASGGKRFCGQCGKPLESGNKYCPYCGAKAP